MMLFSPRLIIYHCSNLELLEDTHALEAAESRDACVMSRAAITHNAPASFSFLHVAAILDAARVMCARGNGFELYIFRLIKTLLIYLLT
jgi:hypothetical protein